MIDPKKMMDDFEAQDRYIVSLRAENDRLRNDLTLRDGVIRDLEEKRVELNAEIGRRDDQIRALKSKVHLCAGYDKMRKALERINNMPPLRGATGDAEKGYAEALHDCKAIAEPALQDTEDAKRIHRPPSEKNSGED